MAAMDLRPAMLAKLKLEGELLKAGGTSLSLKRPPRVVAFGKAANRMAAVLDEILGGRIEAGVCVSPGEPAKKTGSFPLFRGGHPYPKAGTLEGARAALELVSNLTAEDAVIFLVSGGGSAIFEQPSIPMSRFPICMNSIACWSPAGFPSSRSMCCASTLRR